MAGSSYFKPILELLLSILTYFFTYQYKKQLNEETAEKKEEQEERAEVLKNEVQAMDTDKLRDANNALLERLRRKHGIADSGKSPLS